MWYVYIIKLWRAKTNLHNPTLHRVCIKTSQQPLTHWSFHQATCSCSSDLKPDGWNHPKFTKVDVDLLNLCNRKGKNHFHSPWWWIRISSTSCKASKGPSGRKVVFWTKNTLPPTWSEINKMTFLYTRGLFYERMSGCLNLCDPQIPWICLNRK